MSFVLVKPFDFLGPDFFWRTTAPQSSYRSVPLAWPKVQSTDSPPIFFWGKQQSHWCFRHDLVKNPYVKNIHGKFSWLNHYESQLSTDEKKNMGIHPPGVVTQIFCAPLKFRAPGGEESVGLAPWMQGSGVTLGGDLFGERASCRSWAAGVSKLCRRIPGWRFGCHQFYFPIWLGLLIIPIDELIFFRGVESTKQIPSCPSYP